jgi:hypothetical protein
MRKMIILMVLVCAVLVPAAVAADTAQSPSAFCKANPGLIGAGKLYKNFGACVSKQKALLDLNTDNAAKACKAELADAGFASAHGGKTFAEFYGTSGSQGNGNNKSNGNGNAYGKCVSQKASAKTAAQQTALVKAAKKCRTEPLKSQIGAGKTYKNFGACVSAQSKLTSTTTTTTT